MRRAGLLDGAMPCARQGIGTASAALGETPRDRAEASGALEQDRYQQYSKPCREPRLR